MDISIKVVLFRPISHVIVDTGTYCAYMHASYDQIDNCIISPNFLYDKGSLFAKKDSRLIIDNLL